MNNFESASELTGDKFDPNDSWDRHLVEIGKSLKANKGEEVYQTKEGDGWLPPPNWKS